LFRIRNSVLKRYCVLRGFTLPISGERIFLMFKLLTSPIVLILGLIAWFLHYQDVI
jgi:hypothetical protein